MKLLELLSSAEISRRLGGHGKRLDGNMDYGFADFSGVDLTGTDFNGKDLSYAHFENSCLRGCNLNDANFSSAHLDNANLTNSIAHFANFKNCFMDGAILKGVEGDGIDFSHARMRGVDLTGAHMYDVNLKSTLLWTLNGTFNPSVTFHISHDEGLFIRVAKKVLRIGEDAVRKGHISNDVDAIAINLTGTPAFALERVTSRSVAGALLCPELNYLSMESSNVVLSECEKLMEKINSCVKGDL